MQVMTLAAVMSVLLASLQAVAGDAYVRARVDADGQLRIATAAGQTIEPKKDPEQVGFAKPQVAADRSAVGWLAQYPNCCTSYPIPLKLMIMVNGTVQVFTGNGLPIWQWGFLASGTQVAFQQETVHGGLNVHYELRDVATGRRLAEYDPPVGSDDRPLARQNVPKWVTELDAGR
jgi:hypothetical protein